MTIDKSILKFGFYTALLAFIASVGYDVVQVLQVLGSLKPPIDAILIFGFSILIPIPFVLAMLALHYSTRGDKRIWTHAALLFMVIYVTYVVLNYTVQLATVIPMTFRGAYDQVRILDQTPHSLFWDIDALGYTFMGLATLFAALVFEKKGLAGWTRRFFLANTLITPVILLVYFYPTFSYTLLLLASPWMITASGSMLCLALYFNSKQAEENAALPQGLTEPAAA